MNATDKVLLRLADPATRAGLLNADALLELATVCYEIDPAAVAGPTTAAYDRVDLAVPLAPERGATARAMRAGDAMPWDLLVTWDAGSESAPGADAVVVAHLAVRAAGAGGVIDEVDVTAPVPVPGPSGDGREALGLRLHMSALPDPAGGAPLVLPVVIAFLVADGAAPGELLRATAAARRAARPYPVPELPSNSPPRRTERCVCWLVPAAAFDDDGWPGGTGGNADVQRSARLAAARGWLATQGIAVVTT